MKFLVDHADIEIVKKISEHYPVDGITTNPTIISRTGRPPFEVLKELREYLGADKQIHVQVVSAKAEGMIEEGKKIVAALGENTYIKIPVVEEGLKAMKVLAAEGYKVTATTVYLPMQAYLAAKCGAKYVAPYVNKIENTGGDGIALTKVMQNIFDANGYETEILAASFKNAMQVQELCEYGIGAVTLAPDTVDILIKNACVVEAIDAFTANFEKVYGEGKTMLDA